MSLVKVPTIRKASTPGLKITATPLAWLARGVRFLDVPAPADRIAECNYSQHLSDFTNSRTRPTVEQVLFGDFCNGMTVA